MGLFNWLGFGQPRDAPKGAKAEKPSVTHILLKSLRNSKG